MMPGSLGGAANVGIRETLNQNPRLTTGLTIGIIVIVYWTLTARI